MSETSCNYQIYGNGQRPYPFYDKMESLAIPLAKPAGTLCLSIETEPTMSASEIVNLMKSYTTYPIWERYLKYLGKHFWKEHTFWTDGYFACSIGNVSEKMLRKYIENEG